MTLTHGELFAGVGGFSCGFDRAGFETKWCVEIDRDCRDILRRHHPDALILEDVRDVGAHNLPYVDVITFGSPCQDLSVAGKRSGLGGERSGLFFEGARIIGELRPTFAIWENVAGVLSSNGGRDMAVVLGTLRDLGALDIAWSVLDAQWWGVPQRRRRVFFVCDFAGERASQILALSEGLQGHPPPRREAREGTANGFTNGAHGDFRAGVGALRAAGGDVGAGSETIISHAVAAHAAKGGDPTTDNYVVTHSLTGVEPDVVGALPTGHTPNGHGMAGVNSQAAASGHIDGGYSPNLLPSPMGVRRLTPTECERLMSWEDGWTAFGASGKEMSDSTRYRMAGNGVVSNVAEWIARRIREVSA